MKNKSELTKRRVLPTIKGVAFEAFAWAPSHADVDLSIACMFEQEMPGTHLSGGLLDLDEALGGALTTLRCEGAFGAQEMETLLLRTPPTGVRARSILVVGLGNPLTLSSALLERALRVAVREATRLGASTVAFSPNLLDAGLTDLAFLSVEAAMVHGVVGALEAESRLSELGLAPAPALRAWAFDTGPARLDEATGRFLNAFMSIAAES